MRFGKKGNLSHRYVGPYQILRRIDKVAYELDFPRLGVDESLSYEEVPVEILDRKVRRLTIKEIASVKVLWRNNQVDGANWEAEADMKSHNPHVFPAIPTLY
ncbi:hypothetical protein MTR67_023219 [Solanum verrucosum]|uniref:Tf2-1-like SH3-like domain-containing protein n=1 Tax=Solanum verrucosum TaxID=315347 RepID=A0AAF0QT24_SOLVR|nr:hypothetical protein MTR67_023219 [Solanum verrucosum]